MGDHQTGPATVTETIEQNGTGIMNDESNGSVYNDGDNINQNDNDTGTGNNGSAGQIDNNAKIISNGGRNDETTANGEGDNSKIMANGSITGNNNNDVGGGDTRNGNDIVIDHGIPNLDTGCSDGGPSSLLGVGPPSPLTGCYLLIILGEPHSDEHKDIILQRLIKGFLSWDMSDCHVDLIEELNTITQHAPEGEEARYGERLVQYASENLVTEILIHPQYNTLIQCMRNLLSSFTRHRHIIHAGYTFAGNGSWILQDGTFSVSDFSEAFQEHDVQRVLRAYPDTITMNIHCADAGLWNALPDKSYARGCRIRINPVDVLNTGSDEINLFIDYLAPMLVPAGIHDLLETSEVVGNIRFSHPTLYVFPGGQGDAALFGINGFNMLVDGGFSRKSCFWDFARHLDRLDAVLMTRINNSNIAGISAVVERKQIGHVYPQIGHFFCNIPERKGLPSPDEDKDKDPLLIELIERGHHLVTNLKGLNLKPQNCYRDIEPINLYHKVGHGTLDMYVISPSKDSKEVKEFLHKWNAGDQKLFLTKDTKEFNFPIQNLVSICALLVWQPANPDDSITRILFPGSTPDYKIIDGLDKIKHLEFMKHPICTAKTIAPAITSITTKKALKAAPVEKGFPEPVFPSKAVKPITSIEKDNKIIDNKMKTAQQDNKMKEISEMVEEKTPPTKSVIIAKIEAKPKVKDDPIKTETIISDNNKKIDTIDVKPTEKIVQIDNKEITENEIERKSDIEIIKKDAEKEPIKKEEMPKAEVKIITAKPKTEKPRAEVKPVVRSRIDTKPPKSMERKPLKKDAPIEKKDQKPSPTSTPKKQETIKTTGKKREVESKILSRVTKSSPSSTPAKSTKDANNRKVLESKKQISKVKRDVGKATEKKDVKPERKPISRRPRATSPSKRAPGSPIKAPKSKADMKKARLEKDGTTDSSLVSTPSADEVPISKKIPEVEGAQDIDAAKQRELDDLKEEQEVVREIEAVFSRDEKKRQKDLKPGRREVSDITKQDSTTEAEEEEEYLIIEKEEVEQYTEDSINEQESSMTKEEEMQKHQRDSQESEKKRKPSAEEELEAAVAKAEAQEAEDEIKKGIVRDRKQEGLEDEKLEGETRIEKEEGTDEQEDDDIQPDSIDEQAKLTTPEKSDIKAEVQEIITSAKEIAKAKTEIREEFVKTEEFSSPTPEDKISSAKKTSDTKDDLEAADGNKDGYLQESLPEEKFSATIESGATTAPTLPEDERIPLDEIKEDLVIEEKYVKEETKETDIPDKLQKPSIVEAVVVERVLPTKIQFDVHQSLLRDIVKTPDEVADLPVDEEADFEAFDEYAADSKKKPDFKDEVKFSSDEIAKKDKVSENKVEDEEHIENDKQESGQNEERDTHAVGSDKPTDDKESISPIEKKIPLKDEKQSFVDEKVQELIKIEDVQISKDDKETILEKFKTSDDKLKEIQIGTSEEKSSVDPSKLHEDTLQFSKETVLEVESKIPESIKLSEKDELVKQFVPSQETTKVCEIVKTDKGEIESVKELHEESLEKKEILPSLLENGKEKEKEPVVENLYEEKIKSLEITTEEDKKASKHLDEHRKSPSPDLELVLPEQKELEEKVKCPEDTTASTEQQEQFLQGKQSPVERILHSPSEENENLRQEKPTEKLEKGTLDETSQETRSSLEQKIDVTESKLMPLKENDKSEEQKIKSPDEKVTIQSRVPTGKLAEKEPSKSPEPVKTPEKIIVGPDRSEKSNEKSLETKEKPKNHVEDRTDSVSIESPATIEEAIVIEKSKTLGTESKEKPLRKESIEDIKKPSIQEPLSRKESLKIEEKEREDLSPQEGKPTIDESASIPIMADMKTPEDYPTDSIPLAKKEAIKSQEDEKETDSKDGESILDEIEKSLKDDKMEDEKNKHIETIEGISKIENKIEEVQEQIKEKIDETVDKIIEIKDKSFEEVIDKANDEIEATKEKLEDGIQDFKVKVITQISAKLDEIEDKTEKLSTDKHTEIDHKKLEDTKDKVQAVTVDALKKIEDTVIKGAEQINKIETGKEKGIQDISIASVIQPEKKPSYEITSFTTELRETHITTIDSPIKEEIAAEVFLPEEYKVTSFEREDSNLNDIKEEEEEERYSPPRKPSADLQEISKISIREEALSQSRPVSPREVEVAKIVANVAEVLKSEKDITEIIPDFDEKELEEKLSKTVIFEDAEGHTVQRMLVTASSEDGGEETEICPQGSIKFTPCSTPEVQSGKVSPEAGTEEIQQTEENEEVHDTRSKDDTHHTNTMEDTENSIKTESRRESVATEKPIPITKDDIKSPTPSAVSQVSLPEHKDEAKSRTPSKEVSRPESVASHVDEKDEVRRESIVSEKSIPLTKDDIKSATPSAVSEKSLPELKDDAKSPTPSKEVSRPESAASHVDEKDEVRRESIASEKPIPPTKDDIKTPTPSAVSEISLPELKDDAKSPTPSKEVSRPESVASHVEEKDEVRRESIASEKSIPPTKDDIKSPTPSAVSEISLPEHKDDTKSPTPSKEVSRPESVASHVQEKDEVRRESLTSEKSIPPTKVGIKSPTPSAVSEKSLPEHKDDAKSPTSAKEVSRPESVASHVEEKDEIRRESITSEKSIPPTKDGIKSPTPSAVSEKLLTEHKDDAKSPTPAKEISRPESVASHVEEKDEVRRESIASEKPIPPTKDDIKSPTPSAVSEISLPELKDDAKSPTPSKEVSRPESVASHVEEKDEVRRESIASEKSIPPTKDDIKSLTPSAVSEISLPEHKDDTKSPTPSKEVSRPESVASHVQEKDEVRRESLTSEKSIPPTKDDIKSPTPSAVGEKSLPEHKDDAKSPTPSKEVSRPESVDSHADEKDEVRRESIASEKSIPPTKDDIKSPTPSAVSEKSLPEHKDDAKSPTPSKEVSRPESVDSRADEKDEVRRESIASEKSIPPTKDDIKSPTPSAVSEISLPELKDDAKSPTPSKEVSRPESVASHVEEKDEVRRESIASEKSIPPTRDDIKSPTPSAVSEKSLPEHKDDTKSPTPSKEVSRPESVASHVEEKDEVRRESIASEKSIPPTKDDIKSPTPSAVSEKSLPEHKDDAKSPTPSKEISRPESVASHVDEKNEVRRESIASEKSMPPTKDDIKSPTPSAVSQVSLPEHKDDAKSPTPSKEISRPESVASHVDEKDEVRQQSIASEKSIPPTKDDIKSPTPSAVSEISLPEHKDDTKSPTPSKEVSRPESVASHVDEKDEVRRESIASEKSIPPTKDDIKSPTPSAASEKSLPEHKDDAKSPTPSKEVSRPESVASHVDEKDEVRRESIASEKSMPPSKDDIKSSTPSAVSEKLLPEHKDDTKSPTPSKEVSRPESVASHVDEEDEVRRESIASEKSIPPTKDDIKSPTPSAVSEKSLPEHKDEAKSPTPSKEVSRPESVASHVDEKDEVRRESIASEKSMPPTKDDIKSPTPSAVSQVSLPEHKDDAKSPTPSKEVSRPDSVASHVDEKDEVRRESIASEKSIPPAKENITSPTPSAISQVSLPEHKDDTKSPTPTKEVSRPESVASHVDEKDEVRRESIASEKSIPPTIDDIKSPTPSAISQVSLPEHKDDTKSPTPSKEVSRPESVASHVDEKDEVRRESIASEKSIPPAKENITSPTPSAVSEISLPEHKDDAKSPTPSKEVSRPESVASHVDEKDEVRRESIASEKSIPPAKDDIKSPTPSAVSEISLPEHKDDAKSPTPSKEVSRPESVASHVDEKDEVRRESIASETSIPPTKDDIQSPTPSAISQVSLPEHKDDAKSPTPSKEVSRPESVASHVDEKDEVRRESIASEKSIPPTKDDIKSPTPSAISQVSLPEHKDDTKSPTPSKEVSRPESVASHVDEKDEVRRESIASEKSIPPAKENITSPTPSAISQVSLPEHKDDTKSPTPTKEVSRPESVASHVDEKDEVRRESIASEKSIPLTKDDIKSPTPSAVSEISLPEHKDDAKSPAPAIEVSRPESVASRVDEKDEVRRESIGSEKSIPPTKDDIKSPTPSAVSQVSLPEHKDEAKSPTPSKEVSRPESVASHVDEKDEVRRESIASEKSIPPAKDDIKSPTPSAVSEKSLSEHKDDAKSPTPSKEVSRPESVASHVYEKDEVRRESIASEKSIPPAKDDIKSPTPSAVSEKSLSEHKDDAKSPTPSKEVSRPESVASHVDEKDEVRRESIASEKSIPPTKDDIKSPTPSAVSEISLPEHKDDAKSPTPSKEVSRPESVASHVDEKDEVRRESIASEKSIPPAKDDIKSPTPSAVSEKSLSEHKDDAKSPTPSKEVSRPESVASHVDEKNEVRRESIASEKSIPPTKDDIKSPTPSAVSEISLPEHKDDAKSPTPSKEVSRPESVASHVDEKDEVRRESVASEKSIPPTKDDIKSPTPSAVSEKSLPEHKDDTNSPTPSKEVSRPESVASHVDKKDEDRRESIASGKSIPPTKDDIKSSTPSAVSEISLPEHKDETKSPTPSKEVSKPESVASHVDEKDEVRRESIASEKSIPPTKDDIKSATPSAVSEKLLPEHEDGAKPRTPSNEDSRPGSVTSEKSLVKDHVTKSSTEEKASTHRESSLSQSGEKSGPLSRPSSSLSDHEDEDDEILSIKEARSKSVSSIMMTSIYKPSNGTHTFTTLKEELNEQKDTNAEPKFKTKCTISDDQHKTLVQDRRISISPECDVSRRLSDELSSSVKDDITVTELSRIETTVPSPTERTSLTDYKELSDRKTPPTAPVSPSIKTEFNITQSAITTISKELIETSGTSTPKDISGKSSPGLQSLQTTSDSRSIPTPTGHGSTTETPESSPKPTSPFPRVVKEEIKTFSGFSTPDMTRISTPDFIETKTLETLSHDDDTEKIITRTVTTITTVVSSDGKETVTEEQTVRTTDSTEPHKGKVVVTSKTRTTSDSDSKKEEIKDETAATPNVKEVTALKSEFRSATPGSDDYELHEVYSPRSDISSGQASRVTSAWATGSIEDHRFSDDEVPPSPLSVTSQAAHSPPSKFSYGSQYDLQRSSSGVSKKSDLDIDDSQDDIPPQYGSEELKSALPVSIAHKIDPMSISFYGTLPESFGEKSAPIPITTTSATIMTRPYEESISSQSGDGSLGRESFKSKTSGDHKFLDEADLDFEKALEEHRQARGADVMSSVTSKYSYSPSKQTTDEAFAKAQFHLEDVLKAKQTGETSKGEKLDEQEKEKPTDKKDPAKLWGEPLHLPSPMPVDSDMRTTPKKERKLLISKTKLNNEKNLRKRSESPVKAAKKAPPIYMDLAYVPHNGNSYYSHLEFFKRVRARYYVFSGTEPSREVYNALLEAKQTWEDKNLEVTIIPTYDTDVLGYWVSENEELLAKYHIDLSPSASRCTINLQDHETSCSAYRLEF